MFIIEDDNIDKHDEGGYKNDDDQDAMKPWKIEASLML